MYLLSGNLWLAVLAHAATDYPLLPAVTASPPLGLLFMLVLGQARDAGATITKPPEVTFWGGYARYFQDPDRHLWEVVWNPDLVPED